jgi:hypothetical protein
MAGSSSSPRTPTASCDHGSSPGFGSTRLRGDTARVMEVLNAGLASPEHAAFVASLAAMSPPP